MVAIAPFIPMAVPPSSRVEIKAPSSTSGRAVSMPISQIGRPPPVRAADRPTAAVGSAKLSLSITPKTNGPVATQAPGPSRQTSSPPPPTTVRTRSTADSIELLRRPPPLLLSNFFNPLLPQIPANQKGNHKLTVALGKRPMVNPSQVVDFPPLTARIPSENQTLSDPRVTKPKSRPDPPAAGPGKAPLTKSFREAVSASWSKTVDVSFSPPSVSALSTHNGEPALVISEEDELRFAESFRYALIGKFDQGRPVMADIRNDIQAAGFSGDCHVGLIDHRHVIFQFQTEADSHRFWMKKVWKFRGFQAKIFRWTTDFCTQKESSLAPVWINFPLLPVHLCNKETMFNLGSAVGKPLKLDLATAAMDRVLRPSEARVCIEIDVLKPLPHRVWIETKKKGMWQQIIYEDLPEYCSICAKMGHPDSKCKLKHPSQIWIPKKKKEEGKGLQDLSSKEMELGSGSELQPEPLGEKPVQIAGTCAAVHVHQEVNEVENREGKDADQEESAVFDQSLAVMLGGPSNHDDKNLDHFLVNLGHFLELINRQVEETDEFDKSLEPPLAASESSQDCQNVAGLMKRKQSNPEEINGMINGDKGETLHMSDSDYMAELKILQEIQTVTWDERELANLGLLKLPYKEKRKEAINVEVLWEEGEPSSLHRVSSTSDLGILQSIPTESEDGDEGEDQWTENSYEGEPEDVFSSFLEKMENGRRPPKHSKYMEALLSPKANVYSGKLRARNPRICYSEGRNWYQR